MDNISYDILSGGHYFMEDTILCYMTTSKGEPKYIPKTDES